MNFKDLEELYRINQWLGMDIAVICHDILLYRVHKQLKFRFGIMCGMYYLFASNGLSYLPEYVDALRYIKGHPSKLDLHICIRAHYQLRTIRDRLLKQDNMENSLEYLRLMNEIMNHTTTQNGIISLLADFNTMRSLGKLGGDDDGYLHDKVVETEGLLNTYLET